MVILFTTYIPILGSYNKYSTISELSLTYMQFNSHAFFPLQVWCSNFAHIFFHRFPDLHKNSKHFWTLQKRFPNSNFFESHSNVFECNPSKRCQMYFSRIKLLFMSPGKLSSCSNSSPISLYILFSLFIC